MQTNQSIFLPNYNLNTKIEELCTIFQRVSNNLNISKPKPISKELIETLNKFILHKALRVRYKSKYNELDKEKTMEPIQKLTKELIKIYNNNSYSLRVDQVLKSKVNHQFRDHIYPVRLKITEAAQSF